MENVMPICMPPPEGAEHMTPAEFKRAVHETIQGRGANRVPAHCKQKHLCPHNDSLGFGVSTPSVCFWVCGVGR
jgi:hypothetical protein